VRRVAECVGSHGGAVLGAADFGLPGPKGNREVFLYAADANMAAEDPDIEAHIREAVVVE